jgi:hypothetical protein
LLVLCDLLVTHHQPSTISKIVAATFGFVFVLTFSKNYLHDLEIVQKDAPRDSLPRIYAKNQGLN